MRKFLFIILLSVGAILPLSAEYAHASDVSVRNTGFITSNIWYSKETFYAGETVRIYTVIFNGSSYDLSGSVEFLDNDALVGRTEFSLLPSGQVRDVSVPWKTSEGKHVITARIVDASISLRGGQKTAITLENAQAGKSELAVNIDPAVLAAQAQAEAAKQAAATSTRATGLVTEAVQAVGNVIPAPIKEGTSAGIGAIDNLRASLGAQLEAAKNDKGKQIDTLNSPKAVAAKVEKAKQNPGIVTTVSDGAEKPIAYVTYGILAALQYFFEWKILFYGVLLYVAYRLIKWAIQKYRNR